MATRARPTTPLALVLFLSFWTPSGALAQDPPCDLESLAWMAGEWTGRSGGVSTTETWRAPEGGIMLGIHLDVAGPDRSFFEFLRVEPDESGVPVYLASPRGREPTPFRLATCGPGRAVFENPGHDFPQRIVYARDGEALTARIEGVRNGEEASSEWRWESRRSVERRALLDLRETMRRAHLENDPDLLVSLFADDFTSVANGRVARSTPSEQRQRFAAYLGSVEFLEWDDVEPPAVRVSDDGTVGWVRVVKRVRLVPAGDPDAEPDHTVFAWLETWEKRDGAWRLTSVTSTDRSGG